MFMHIKCKNIKLLILEIIVWLFLILGVIIQKSPFVYSLGLIIPSSVFSIFVYMYYLIYNKQKISYVAKLIIIIFVSLIIIFNAIEDIMSTKRIYEQTLNACNNVQILQKEIPDLNEEEVLYIGNGLSSYYLKVKPYINYVTTIFFANENEAYMQSEYVNNLNEKVLNYAGKYIIIDSTEMSLKFRVSDKILEYIEKNYHYKQSTNISVYEIENEDCSLIYERNE